MGLGGCYSCIKYLMFAFNFLFWLLGCAILGVGIWVRVDPNFEDYVDSSDKFDFIYTGAYMLIAIGSVIMIIGFLGCCGAIRESQCMLATFFVFLFILFASLLGAGIMVILGKSEMKEVVSDVLEEAVKTYNDESASKELMDRVQKTFECCGSGSLASGSYMKHGMVPPASCNIINYSQACDEKLFEFISEHLIIIAGVAIGIGVVMLLGMIFSMMLCCAIREL